MEAGSELHFSRALTQCRRIPAQHRETHLQGKTKGKYCHKGPQSNKRQRYLGHGKGTIVSTRNKNVVLTAGG